MVETDFLEVLSLKDIDTEDGRARLAKQFRYYQTCHSADSSSSSALLCRKAAQGSGFMVMTDHGIDPELSKLLSLSLDNCR